jgi:hypothetical protein
VPFHAAQIEEEVLEMLGADASATNLEARDVAS